MRSNVAANNGSAKPCARTCHDHGATNRHAAPIRNVERAEAPRTRALVTASPRSRRRCDRSDRRHGRQPAELTSGVVGELREPLLVDPSLARAEDRESLDVRDAGEPHLRARRRASSSYRVRTAQALWSRARRRAPTRLRSGTHSSRSRRRYAVCRRSPSHHTRVFHGSRLLLPPLRECRGAGRSGYVCEQPGC